MKEALGRKQLNSRDIACGKARFSMIKAAARGIQRRLMTCQCIQACIIIAQGALGISQCRQHGLLITQRGLPLGEAVEWCGETVTVREATRLRRFASERQADGGDGAALVTAGSGGVGAGSSAG